MNISGKRLTVDEYFLAIAKLVSSRGTCARRRVGCVVVDNGNRILATGYNGVPRGVSHCIDYPCPGADYPSGEGLDKCDATHAEQNALLQCHDVEQIHTCYTTLAMCSTCTKLLLNTNCQRIVTIEDYGTDSSKELWRIAGRTWEIADDRTINIVSALVRVETARVK